MSYTISFDKKSVIYYSMCIYDQNLVVFASRENSVNRIPYAEFARLGYWIISSKPFLCPIGSNLLRLNVIIPSDSPARSACNFWRYCRYTSQTWCLRMHRNTSLVCAGRHFFLAQVNATVLWPLDAEILWPAEQDELARLVQHTVRFLEFPRRDLSTFSR